MKTKRVAAGFYEVTDGKRVVEVISRADLGRGLWIAAARWTRSLYTDPVQGKKEAIAQAQHMLTDSEGSC